MKKPKQDSSKMGRYYRTTQHKDNLSQVMTNRRPKFKKTQIEINIAQRLTALGIKFQQEYLIQTKKYKDENRLFFRHTYDFFIPEYNLLLECDGDYWHESLQAKLRDTKCSYVANAEGFNLVRLSGTFIKELTNNDQLLRVITSNPTFSVFGDLYNTVPVREFTRNSAV